MAEGGLQHPTSDVERLRRDAPKRADKAFRYGGPGSCGVCDTRIYSALDAHMIACHLELGQLWALPCHMVRSVEGVRACLPGTSGREAMGDQRWKS